jgi:hypothetical protein
VLFAVYQIFKGNVSLRQTNKNQNELLILASGPELNYLNKIKTELFPNDNETTIYFESKHAYVGELGPNVKKGRFISIGNLFTVLFKRNLLISDVLNILNNQIKLEMPMLHYKIFLEILKDDFYISFFEKLFSIYKPEKVLTSSLSLANISARSLNLRNYQAVDGLGISEVPAFPYTGEVILCPSAETIEELSNQYNDLDFQIVGKEVYL